LVLDWSAFDVRQAPLLGHGITAMILSDATRGLTVKSFWVSVLLLIWGGWLSLPSLVGFATPTQQSFPDPPNDVTRVYYLNSDQKLRPLPFEPGITELNVFVPAREDKVTQVRVKGTSAETVLTNDNLRFYAFVADRMEPPPHQLVRLTPTKSNRQLKISVVKGRDGYAPFDKDTIGLEHRLLERLRVSVAPNRILFVNYMELRPKILLTPGEYAIIGDSLADMATFRIK
jgi:hypothetical protein